MNSMFIKLGLESGMLNYIDNETPRRYFLSANSTEEDLEVFLRLVVRECVRCCSNEEDVIRMYEWFEMGREPVKQALTIDEIEELWYKTRNTGRASIGFCRAIERHHGIKV